MARAQGHFEGEPAVGVGEPVAQMGVQRPQPVADGLGVHPQHLADLLGGGAGRDVHPQGLDEPVAPLGGQPVERRQLAGGEMVDQGGVGQQPQRRQMVLATDQRGVRHDTVVDELQYAACPAEGVRGLGHRHGQAHRGTGAGQGRAEHLEPLGAEFAGDEQMRLRDVEVGEDVAVEPRLDVFGDGRAQGDEKTRPRQFPGGGRAQLGHRGPGERGGGQEEV